jgi:hypothetical protein
MNEGWFGNCSDESLPAMPISEAAELNRFEEDWNLTRRGSTGLSIVVPYAVPFDEDDLLYAVVHEYLGRILTGGLDVELDLPSRSAPMHINALTVEKVITEQLQVAGSDTANWQRTLDELKVLETILNLPASQTLEMPAVVDLPKWSKRLPEEVLADANSDLARFVKSAREDLGRVGHVRIRCTCLIRKRASTGHAQRSYFDVVISRSENQNERIYPVFWRSWLRISGRRMGAASRGYRTMLLADDDAISELLGDAEGPAHTEWSHLRPKFVKKQYEYGSDWLTFVRTAPSTLTELLVGAIREADEESLVAFFPIPGEIGGGDGDDGDGSGRKPKGGDGGTGGDSKEPKPISSGTAIMEAVAVGDGFKLRPVGDPGKVPPIPKSRRLKVRVAYATARGNPFSRWNSNDFDLKSLVERARRNKKISGCSATVSDVHPYELTLTISAKDLRGVKFEVVGFGSTRDLEVEVDAVAK